MRVSRPSPRLSMEERERVAQHVQHGISHVMPPGYCVYVKYDNGRLGARLFSAADRWAAQQLLSEAERIRERILYGEK